MVIRRRDVRGVEHERQHGRERCRSDHDRRGVAHRGTVDHARVRDEEVDRGPVRLVAWDTDMSFSAIRSQFPPWDEPAGECEVRQSGRAPSCDPLIAWFAGVLRPHFVAASEQLLDEVFRPEVIEPELRAWSAQIQPFLGPLDLFAFDPQLLIDRVAERHETFRETIAR